jgi:hypothetical protein
MPKTGRPPTVQIFAIPAPEMERSTGAPPVGITALAGAQAKWETANEPGITALESS